MEGNDAGQAIGAFLDEVARLLPLLPQDGLILDVRNNGGGYVYAGESLLQYFTPKRVQPEPTQFINTPVSAELCRKVEFLEPWAESIEASIETGAQYSGGIPLYPAEAVNEVGQLYHGPVVLVTDAFCYSTTDFFAAGFQDAGIGTVLGVDGNTGAGGANVWDHAQLVQSWPGGPFTALPAGAMLRVALRRSLRVGERWGGQPVEDLGVIPDARHEMTARDLLEGNADLMEAAGAILAAGTPRTLDVEMLPPAGVAGAPAGRHARRDHPGADQRRRLRRRSPGGDGAGDRRPQHAAGALHPPGGGRGHHPPRGLRRGGDGGGPHAAGHGQLSRGAAPTSSGVA